MLVWVFHGFQVNFTHTCTCFVSFGSLFLARYNLCVKQFHHMRLWCFFYFVGSCYHVRVLGCVRTCANKVQCLCDIWIGFNITRWSIRVQLHAEWLFKGLFKEEILEFQCLWGYFKQWKCCFKNKYPSQNKLKAVLSPGRNAVGQIDFRAKRYPASRGYIFAVWAGVQKVASFRTPSHTTKM